MPLNTFAKLPVRALINKSKKKSYGHQLGPMTHFLMNQKFDPILYFRGSPPLNTFAKLPVHALINDLEKMGPKKVNCP